MGKKSNRHKLVPGCEAALEQMKYEIAAELGLPVGSIASYAAADAESDAEFASELGAVSPGSPQAGSAAQAGGAQVFDWGSITAREAGALGGHITQRLVRLAQQTMP